MCGLFGFITKDGERELLSPAKKRKIAAITTGLSIAMEERGTDSTGVAAIDFVNKTRLMRRTKKARSIADSINRIARSTPPVLIGHTRAATVGAVTKENSHPFVKGSIVGAHNGSVSNWREINNLVKVDSEVVFELLNEEKNDFDVFKQLSGRFALTWTHKNDPNTIFACRHVNPLHFCFIESLQTYFWCSTKEALEVVLVAALGTGKNRKIWELKEDIVYQIGGDLEIKRSKTSFRPTTIHVSGYTSQPGIKQQPLLPATVYDAKTHTYRNYRPDSTTSDFSDAIARAVIDVAAEKKSPIINTEVFFEENKAIAARQLYRGCSICDKCLVVEPEIGPYWSAIDEEFICFQCRWDLGREAEGYMYCDMGKIKPLIDYVEPNYLTTHQG